MSSIEPTGSEMFEDPSVGLSAGGFGLPTEGRLDGKSSAVVNASANMMSNVDGMTSDVSGKHVQSRQNFMTGAGASRKSQVKKRTRQPKKAQPKKTKKKPAKKTKSKTVKKKSKPSSSKKAKSKTTKKATKGANKPRGKPKNKKPSKSKSKK